MKTVRIRRLETIEEMEMRKFILQYAGKTPKPSEEDKTLEQFGKLPKSFLESFLTDREFQVGNKLYNELLLLMKEFNIPYKPIENGVEIEYLSKDSSEYISLQ